LTPPEHPAAVALLSLPSLIFGAAVRLRNHLYERPGASRNAPIPVLSVGNLTVGGTGKTPLVAWLARRLREQGLTPAVVSRGYGGTAGRGPLVVTQGGDPTCGPEVCGDEPFELARTLSEVVVIVGSDRVAGADEAARQGADLVILDDGFQHRRLARDLDIVLLDSSNPFGNYRLLPAGWLREPIGSLARADIVVITRARPGERFELIRRTVRNLNADAPILSAGHRALGFFDLDGRVTETPRRAVAFCGIGNPTRFRIDLEHAGVEILEFRSHRDHHAYVTSEFAALEALARTHDAPLVTTQKDAVRLESLTKTDGAVPLLSFRITAEIHEPESLMNKVREALAAGKR